MNALIGLYVEAARWVHFLQVSSWAKPAHLAISPLAITTWALFSLNLSNQNAYFREEIFWWHTKLKMQPKVK
jgi:hypothetical protein